MPIITSRRACCERTCLAHMSCLWTASDVTRRHNIFWQQNCDAHRARLNESTRTRDRGLTHVQQIRTTLTEAADRAGGVRFFQHREVAFHRRPHAAHTFFMDKRSPEGRLAANRRRRHVEGEPEMSRASRRQRPPRFSLASLHRSRYRTQGRSRTTVHPSHISTRRSFNDQESVQLISNHPPNSTFVIFVYKFTQIPLNVMFCGKIKMYHLLESDGSFHQSTLKAGFKSIKKRQKNRYLTSKTSKFTFWLCISFLILNVGHISICHYTGHKKIYALFISRVKQVILKDFDKVIIT